MPELCLSYAPRSPSLPLAPRGSEVGSPTPLPAPAALLALTLQPPDLLSRLAPCLCGHPCRTRPRRRRRVSIVRRRWDASLHYVGRSSETAGQQDLMTRDRFLLRSLASGDLRSSLKDQPRRIDASLDSLESDWSFNRTSFFPRLEL